MIQVELNVLTGLKKKDAKNWEGKVVVGIEKELKGRDWIIDLIKVLYLHKIIKQLKKLKTKNDLSAIYRDFCNWPQRLPTECISLSTCCPGDTAGAASCFSHKAKY